MPTRNSLKIGTKNPKSGWITVQSPRQGKLISRNSEIGSPSKKAEVNVTNVEVKNFETVQELGEGSTLMTFANGSMKVPNFVITNVQSLSPDSQIKNSVLVKNARNIVVQTVTPVTHAQNIGRFSKDPNVSSVKKEQTSFIKQEKIDASPSQDASQWMKSPVKRYVAKRKILPTDISTSPKVENTDGDHAYINKYQSPIITLKKITPAQNQAKPIKIADRICRLCLKYRENLTPLFWGDRAKPQFIRYLKECCNLEVIRDDPMPKSICSDCRLKLLAAWDFRNQCQKSDKTLRKYYKLPPKNDCSHQADKCVVEKEDKAIQVECFDRSKRIMALRSLKTEDIKEDKDSADDLRTEFMDIVGKIDDEDEDIDENSVSYFLDSFTQEVSNGGENPDDDGNPPGEADEVEYESCEEQKLHQEEVKEKRLTTRKRKKLQENEMFLCHMCPRVFTTKNFLERHANLHLTKKTYTCDTCNKVFKTQGKLTTHLKVHDTTKRFECDVCGLKYAHEYLLNSHLRLHGRGKPFRTEKNFLCEVCSKSFVSQSGLKHHQKLHMNVKPYKCKFCEKTFTMPIYRKKHEVRHAADRQFKCHLCPAIYASGNGLTNHLLRHTGEAHYHCNVCGKSFRRRKYLNEHTYTHTGEKPYICKMCGIGYGNSGSLFAHQRRCKLNFNDELAQAVMEEVVVVDE